MTCNNSNLFFYENDKDRITTSELTNFLKELDKILLDPICKRDYFLTYEILSKKFYNEGNLIFCKSQENQLIGLAVLYADKSKYSYAYESYIGVLQEFNGKGIASELMRREISLAKNLGMIGIMTNCHKNNERKISLNKNIGFKELKDEKDIHFFSKMNPKWDGKIFFILKF